MLLINIKQFYTPVFLRGVVRPTVQFSPAYYIYTVEDIDTKLCRNNYQHMIPCLPEKEVTLYLCSEVMPRFTILLVRPTPPTPLNIFMPNLVEIITSSWYCACEKVIFQKLFSFLDLIIVCLAHNV